MGNSDPMNTPEASAGRVDLDHLSRCLSPSGSRNNAYIGEHFNETPGWSELASEVLRLSALVAELTAANAALVVRVQEAWVLLKGWHDLDNDGTNSGYPATANGTRAWLAGGAA